MSSRTKGSAVEFSDVTRKRAMVFWHAGLTGLLRALRANDNRAPHVLRGN